MDKSCLINNIDEKDLKSLYYCTACIKVTEGNDYNYVYDEFIKFVRQTISEEEGCVEFFIVPGNREAGEFILWEIWKDEDAFHFHHNAQHTKEYFGKELTEIKWLEKTTLSQ